MTALEITQQYFDLSNQSDMDGIGKLMTDATTYSSANTGMYLGVDDIIAMQTDFHNSYQSLNWQINSIDEIKPGIVLVDFDFIGLKDGQEMVFSGLEYIVVYNDKIQHIEIKNK